MSAEHWPGDAAALIEADPHNRIRQLVHETVEHAVRSLYAALDIDVIDTGDLHRDVDTLLDTLGIGRP